jgi:5'(3')-deoxyribonucleotidase
MARVGIDLDGVGYVFENSWIDAANAYLDLPEDLPYFKPQQWAWYLDLGFTLEEFLEVFAWGIDHGFIFTGPVSPGFAEMVKAIQMNGHSIHIVTDRSLGTPGNAQRATIAWLAQHGVPYDSITFSRDKTVVKTDFFIEDKLENYDALREAGTACYLLNRPWNQPEGWDLRCRINSLDQFARLVISNTREFIALQQDLVLG